MTDMQGAARPFEKASIQNKRVKKRAKQSDKKVTNQPTQKQKSISLKKRIHSSGNRKRRESAVFPNAKHRKDTFSRQAKIIIHVPLSRGFFFISKRAVRRKFATYRRNFPFYRICPFSCRKPDKKVYFFIAATCLATSALRSSLFFRGLRPSHRTRNG